CFTTIVSIWCSAMTRSTSSHPPWRRTVRAFTSASLAWASRSAPSTSRRCFCAARARPDPAPADWPTLCDPEDTMEYRKLGGAGVKVSTLCLGAMTFGEPDEKSMMHGIAADEATAHRLMDRAIAAGVNFIDTADVYG